jgi:hypothetical protein
MIMRALIGNSEARLAARSRRHCSIRSTAMISGQSSAGAIPSAG